MKSEDLIQKKLMINLIHTIVNDSDFWELSMKGQINYLVKNAIASYSLYNSEYELTQGAKSLLESRGFDVSKSHKRSSIHHIRSKGNGSKYGKKLTTFEHLVPAVVQLGLIKRVYHSKGDVTHKELCNILDTCGRVFIMTQEENKLLEANGLRSEMPHGCNPMENPIQRYERVGILVEDVNVSVKGNMMR